MGQPRGVSSGKLLPSLCDLCPRTRPLLPSLMARSIKNTDIEVLRAIAVIYVLLAHVASLLSPTSSYWKVLHYSRFGSGVDLFFAVSGYVIVRSIASSIPDSRSWDSFRSFALPFWQRRFWRLFPSVFVWVGISLAVSLSLAHTGYFFDIKTLLPAASAAVFQYANFNFLTCRTAGTCGELGVYWSLSLENQFYFALPLLAFLFPRRHLVKVFLAIFAIQFFIPRTLSAETPTFWPFRTDAIALGVVLGLLHHRLSETPPDWLQHRWLRVGAISILLFLLAILTKPEPFISFAVGLTAVVSAVLVWIASFDRNLVMRPGMAKDLMVWIGARSYAIYLTHPLMILVTKYIWFPLQPTPPNFDWPHTLVYLSTFLGLTLVASDLNYRLIENPLRWFGERLASRRREALRAAV